MVNYHTRVYARCFCYTALRTHLHERVFFNAEDGGFGVGVINSISDSTRFVQCYVGPMLIIGYQHFVLSHVGCQCVYYFITLQAALPCTQSTWPE